VDNEKIKGWLATAALLAFGVFGGSSASAAPIMIDFTDASWLAAQGQTTYSRTYGSVEVTLSATGAMTFNASEAPNAPVADLALHGDGIGIGNDEISWLERMDVYFSAPVTVLGYYFLDFFAGEGPNGGGELATVVMDGISFVDEGHATDGIGYYSRDVSVVTTAISFLAGLTQGTGNFKFSDFALAGILIDDAAGLISDTDPVSVPEPQTLALFAAGLLGLVFLRERRAVAQFARRG